MNLRDEIEVLKKHLSDKTEEHEQATAVIATQTAEIAELKDEITEALQNIEDRDVQIEKLESVFVFAIA